MTKPDLKLLHHWFQTPHVFQWYARGEYYTFKMIKEKYLSRLNDESILSFIIYEDNNPIGYIQRYLVDKHLPEGIRVYQHPLFHQFNPQELAGIDLFIAEKTYLHTGCSSLVLQQFINSYIKGNFKAVLVDPNKNNHIAQLFFEKNGFRPILSQDKSYNLMINDNW